MKHNFKQILVKVLSRVGLIFLGVIVSLVALEIVFRWIYPDPSPRLTNQALQLHHTYGISFTPNAEGWNTSLRGEYSSYVRINSKGLRSSTEYSYQKSEDSFRILVLGDSFTAALQVSEEETFPSLLESRLNQQYPGLKVEVINAGVVGYGTANQFSYFTHEGYKYEPDLVILAFFTGNDIMDNISPPHYVLEDGILRPIPVDYSPDVGTPPWAREGTSFRNLRNYLYTHSRLYSVMIELLVYSAIRQSPDLANLLILAGFVEATRPVMNTGNIYSVLAPSEEAWQMTEALLLALNEEVQGQGSQLLIVLLPDETEVDVEKWEKLFQEYPDLFKENSTHTKPSQRLARFLDKHGILYLSLQPAFQAYRQKSGEALFYQIDGHWTPKGHVIAAQEIYNYLIEHTDRKLID